MYYLETNSTVLKTNKVLAFFLIALFVGNGTLFAQNNDTSTAVSWYSFEGALMFNKERAEKGLPTKKIFIDVYTDWCGWCKRMDATTFAHPVIVEKLNGEWIPVKFNAERKDTITINGQQFVYVNGNPNSSRGLHQLAHILLNGQMSYPSYALIDETGKPIQNIQGYQNARQFEMLLDFFSSNIYKTTDWQEFQKTYQGLVSE